MSGIAYGHVLWWCHSVRFMGLVMFALPIGIAASLRWAESLARMDLGWLTRVGGFVGGATCLWVGWISWVYSLTDGRVLVFDPTVLARGAARLATHGVWSFHGWTPVDAQLYCLWGLEALILVGLSTLLARNLFSLVCMRCGRSITPDTVESLEVVPGLSELRRAMVSHALLELGRLRAAPPRIDPSLRVEVWSCDCGGFACISVEHVRRGRQTDRTVVDLLVDRLVVGDAELEALERLSEQVEQKEKEADQARAHKGFPSCSGNS